MFLNPLADFNVARVSPEQRAMIRYDSFRGIVAGRAGDAAARMGAAAAMVEALQRPAIIGMTEHRPRREQLVQRQRAVKDIAAEQAELPLEVEGGKDLPADHGCAKAPSIGVDGCDHEVGNFLAM